MELRYEESIVTDDDIGNNGLLSYTFAQSYPQFLIDSDTGRISLNTMLDFEEEKVYDLTFLATDKRPEASRTATGVVQVNVSPENE